MSAPAARQILRALRGPRSQVAFSRRLGYRSNVAAEWEGGRREPSAAELFRAAVRCGVDVDAAVASFHPRAAPAFAVDGLGPWLDALRGGATQKDLAERTGFSRQQVQRWLTGRAVPKVGELIGLVDGMTGRAPDLIAELVDIEQVPALAERWRANRAAARLAFDHPWSAAVLTALETTSVRAGPHDDLTLAARLGLDPHVLREALGALDAAGLIRRTPEGYAVVRTLTADVRATPADHAALRAFWVRVLADRLDTAGASASFNLFSASHADMVRIREVQRAAYREIRSIVAASEPNEAVGLVVLALARLTD